MSPRRRRLALDVDEKKIALVTLKGGEEVKLFAKDFNAWIRTGVPPNNGADWSYVGVQAPARFDRATSRWWQDWLRLPQVEDCSSDTRTRTGSICAATTRLRAMADANEVTSILGRGLGDHGPESVTQVGALRSRPAGLKAPIFLRLWRATMNKTANTHLIEIHI